MSLETFGSWRAVLVGSVSLVAITLTGCSSANNPFKGPGGFVHPQIGPMSYSQEFKYNRALLDSDPVNDPDTKNLEPFELALARAEKLDVQLYNAMWWNDTYGFLTGIGMFGAGVATLAFGIFDASRTLLLAGGLATSTLAGVRTFYPFGDRNDLYSKGRVALQCAVEATQTAVDMSNTLAGGDFSSSFGVARALSLDEILLNARYAAGALQEQVVAEASRTTSKNVQEEVRRQLTMLSASGDAVALQQAVDAGRAVQAQIQPSVQASTLNAIVLRIQSLVDAEANKLRPDPEKALSVARQQLQDTLANVQKVALEGRDVARKIDNQNLKPLAVARSAEGSGGAPTGDTDAQKLAKETAQAKSVADKALAEAAAAAKASAVAKTAADDALVAAKNATTRDQNAINQAVQAALNAENTKNTDAKVLAMAEIEARAAAEQKAAADAAAAEPFSNAAYWAGILSARLDAIATKLKNIDSCTATFAQTG